MNNESIKMSDIELSEVRMLQEKFQQKVFQFGHSSMKQKQLKKELKFAEEEEDKLWNEWYGLQKMETELIDKLLKKYGEGSLDMSAGMFIPEEKSG